MIAKMIEKLENWEDKWENKIYESPTKTIIAGAIMAGLSYVGFWAIYILHNAFK
jgi:hypothetical protein